LAALDSDECGRDVEASDTDVDRKLSLLPEFFLFVSLHFSVDGGGVEDTFGFTGDCGDTDEESFFVRVTVT
jgi:hypothetical protein